MIEVTKGGLPIVLGMPHSGTDIPDSLVDKFGDIGREMAETDWHIPRLYNGLGMDISVVQTPIHRYVIDVDQPPVVSTAFPWLASSGLVPLTDRSGHPLYKDGAAPDIAEMRRRIDTYHVPYQAAISGELERLRDIHGIALLIDCHSISSFNPQDELDGCPDFNIWTNQSRSCAQAVERCVLTRCRAVEDADTRLSDGCAGGWSVQRHGQPQEGIHALRLELAQVGYMDEAPPWAWRADKAERLRSTLYRVLNDLLELLYERAQR